MERKNHDRMFDFSHTLIIGSLLFLLVPLIALSQWGVLITWRERVKHPYIKKCALSVITPEAVCCNVKTGTILLVGSMMDQKFISDRL